MRAATESLSARFQYHSFTSIPSQSLSSDLHHDVPLLDARRQGDVCPNLPRERTRVFYCLKKLSGQTCHKNKHHVAKESTGTKVAAR
jgi:hypothetical protein